MPEIDLNNITKTFNEGTILAVDDVTLKLHDRDYIFILGPSGCGKTTLLKIISGLLKPTSGQVLINGKDVTEDPPQSRGIAFIFQNFEIFPMSVWDNCTYSLTARGFSREKILQEGERALKIVGLLDRADEYPIDWSNGDLQRIGLARAICSGAKILIMDEPLGSLDPKINRMFRWELRRIIKESGLTAIQVTHDQNEAMSLADRIIIMRSGNLLQEDSPDVLYQNPDSIFIGNFLGGLNILEGYIYHFENRDRYNVKVRLGGPRVSVKSRKDVFELDENCVLAIRCENIFLFPDQYNFKEAEEDWTDLVITKGLILEKFLTGKELMFIVEIDNGDQITVKKPEIMRFELNANEPILVGFFPDDFHLFKYPNDLAYDLALQ